MHSNRVIQQTISQKNPKVIVSLFLIAFCDRFNTRACVVVVERRKNARET